MDNNNFKKGRIRRKMIRRKDQKETWVSFIVWDLKGTTSSLYFSILIIYIIA
jgi:hypothetical protein